jgi:hypothetical protein
MPRYAYIIVEGAQDVELVGRLLHVWKFNRLTHLDQLDHIWHPVIPERFPYGGKLLQRVPIPVFFAYEDYSIAVHSATGQNEMARMLWGSLTKLEPAALQAVGFMMDADQKQPRVCFKELQQHIIRTKNDLGLVDKPDLPLPDQPGEVLVGLPRTGIFVLPDNQNPGALEDILIEAGMVNYPKLMNAAANYVENIDSTDVTTEDLKEYNKPFGRKKAQLGSVASILRPGRAFQMSLQDNRWLHGDAYRLPRVRALTDFFAQLLDLEGAPTL